MKLSKSSTLFPLLNSEKNSGSRLQQQASQSKKREMNRCDRWLIFCAQGFAAIAGLITLLITGFLLRETWPILSSIGLRPFFTDARWNPTSGEFNLLPIVCGTLLTSAGAIALAAPLGILSALFCQVYAPSPLAKTYRRIIELLAGIPSVVYGFWGLVVLVPMINRWQPPGQGLFTGIIILTLMVLPTVALMTQASLSEVPFAYRQGAIALGLSRWTQLRHILLPAARSGVLTGLVLAGGRALGETMALLMVCGNVVQVPESLFSPVRTLTANIALEMAYATGDHRAALFVSGLILLLTIAVLVGIADWLSRAAQPDGVRRGGGQ